MTKLFADVKVLKKLPPDVFWPVPLVDSAIVKMTVNRHRYADRIRDYPGFQDVVRSIYSSRRKTLSNSLLSLCASHGIKKNPARKGTRPRQNSLVGLANGEAGRAGGPARIGTGGETRQDLVTILERVGIRPESRGEELDLEKLIELSNEISDYLNLQKDFV